MAKQTINLGTTANDGTGDTLRTGAFKINQNFDELYSAIDNGINNILSGDGIDVVNSFGQITITNTLPNRGAFKIIAINGQLDLVAEELSDTLTLIEGENITLTTTPSTNSIEISLNPSIFNGYRLVNPPLSSVGSDGDLAGDLSFDNENIYYCTSDYNSSDIWVKQPWGVTGSW